MLTLSVLSGCVHHWQPATLPNATQTIIHSASTDKDYLIQVATIGDKPKNGYPVIYVLDGNAFFAPSVSVAQMLYGRPAQSAPKSLMVVGIGYATSKQFDIKNRTHDYTPPAMSYPAPKGEQVVFGGADNFHRFIRDELAPMLDKKFGINHQYRTLFGHSYGGLFGVYVLFRHGASFDNYLIASPSLWWNDKSIYQHQHHTKTLPNLKNVLISLGEHELNARHRSPEVITHWQDSEAYKLTQFLGQTLPDATSGFKFHLGQTHGMNAYVSIISGLTLVYEACVADDEC